MREGGRLSAAIAVIEDVETQHRPARLALKAWGEASRYAGAKDRAWVSGLVLDVLRHKRSLAWQMRSDNPRATVFGALRFGWGWSLERIVESTLGPHGPGQLANSEVDALEQPAALSAAPEPVRGDYPDWLDGAFARVFADERAEEAAALAARASVDLRVNTLKTTPERALKVLAPLGALPAGALSNALRLPAPDPAARTAPVEAAPEFQKGWFEVQDLSSQVAAAAAGEVKGRQVLDYCAGGGGKALALGAAMANTGQLYAYDAEPRRLGETVKRASRAGLRNLQVRSPLKPDALADLDGRMDVVFVDAPCTGSGTWRRHPDAKWRLRPGQLARRIEDQNAVLAEAARHVKPGGRLVYVTCSVFAEENEDRVAAFLAGRPAFKAVSAAQQIGASGLADAVGFAAIAARQSGEGFIRLTPRSFAADGFFIAVLERTP